MKLIPGLLIHHTPDGALAAATGEAAKVLNGMIRLSPVAAFLLRHLETETTEDALVATVLANYTAEEATGRGDIARMLSDLRAAKLLID